MNVHLLCILYDNILCMYVRKGYYLLCMYVRTTTLMYNLYAYFGSMYVHIYENMYVCMYIVFVILITTTLSANTSTVLTVPS